MFQGKMEEYKVYKPKEVIDNYNYSTLGYTNKGTSPIHIVVQDRTLQNSNGLDAYTSTLVGYTEDSKLDIGWKIADKFIVKSVMPHRHYNVLYLQEVENGV